MEKLIQISYASFASFPISANPYLIEPEVADILSTARAFNKAKMIAGVLCFGNGRFFQCLQGEQAVLNHLFEVIGKDTRHTDVKLLQNDVIDKKTFMKWHMKYVGVESELDNIGGGPFEPHNFSKETLQSMIETLLMAEESV